MRLIRISSFLFRETIDSFQNALGLNQKDHFGYIFKFYAMLREHNRIILEITFDFSIASFMQM